MEAFLGTTGQHLASFLNLLLMKRMDTGDRMLDTTLQMLLSTLIGGFITGIITIYSKGMWGEVRNRARALWDTAEYNPLQFDPRLAPDKPANGTNFLYKSFYDCSDWPTFMSWFFTHHEDKYFPQKLGASIYIPTKPKRRRQWDDDDDRNDPSAGSSYWKRPRRDFHLLNGDDIQRSPGVRRFRVPEGVYLPIWRSKLGHYVYMNTGGDTVDDEDVSIFSDSAEAIRDCVRHVSTHGEKMDTFKEELRAAGELDDRERKIYDYVNDEIHEKTNGVNPKKTMDTLFFTQKEDVVRMLSGFKEGKLFGAHLPIDNKLGFLLYGPPGTGKTGLIAAVANFLGRDVVNVDTSRIKTRKALDSALEMDCRRHIFVFEEFDTMPGVGRRETGEEDSTGAQRSGAQTPGEDGNGGGAIAQQMALMMMAGGAAKKEGGGGGDFMEELREERKAAADKLDLGYLLRKLDGLESGNGRIILATTNHPERIDPALLRPGRFGLQIHLTRCTTKMLREMVHMIYQIEAGSEQSDALEKGLVQIPELKWAPAELLQLGVTLPTAEAMVRHLLEEEPACFR